MLFLVNKPSIQAQTQTKPLETKQSEAEAEQWLDLLKSLQTQQADQDELIKTYHRYLAAKNQTKLNTEACRSQAWASQNLSEPAYQAWKKQRQIDLENIKSLTQTNKD